MSKMVCEMSLEEETLAFRRGEISYEDVVKHYPRSERRAALQDRQRIEKKKLRRMIANKKAIKDIESKCGRIFTFYIGGHLQENITNMINDYIHEHK